MIPKTLLRFVLMMFVTVGGMLYLSFTGTVSANKNTIQEAVGKSVASESSNTDYIFFGSITRLFTVSL